MKVRRGIIAQGRYWEKKPAKMKKRVLSLFFSQTTKQAIRERVPGHQIAGFPIDEILAIFPSGSP